MSSAKLWVWIILVIGALISLSQTLVAQSNPGRHITGVVVDLNGAVVNEAQLSLKVGQQILATATTRTDGQFEFTTDTSATLLLEVTSPGFDPGEVQLESTTRFPLRIVLTPQSVSADVTITATRTATHLGETAASVVLLTNAELTTSAAATLDDTLRQVAGFSLFRRSGSRTANPTAQGVSLRATGASGASRALVLADGVPLNDPFGGWIYWDRVPRESINQVEVLLGGASHLYGSAALGGVIDITTKRESLNSFSLVGSYGNESTANVSLFTSGTKGNWAGSIAAESFHTGGYVLVPANQRGLVDTAAGTRDFVINLRVERKFGNYGRFSAGASSFGEARENGTRLQINRTHLRQFFFGISSQSATAGSISVRAYGGTQVYDQTFSAISTDRNSETLTRLQRVPAQVFGVSTQWSKLIGRRQTLVAGFEGREVRGASDELVYLNGRPGSLVGAGGRERDGGVYLEDLLRLGSRVFVSIGGRLDHWRNFAARSATRPVTASNPTSVTSFPDRNENAFSPHASVVYRISDRVSGMASMSRAFRAPTLNELYRSFRVGNVLTLANENLQAERLTGGEAGLRATSSNEKVTVRGNFFWNDITRPVANVTLSANPALITRQRQNLGRTRSRGVELQLDAQLRREWSLSTSYLFADAKVVRFPANLSLEGLLLPQVPRHQFTFQMRYKNPLIGTAALQARASGSQFDDDQNQFRLGSYFTIDAFLSRKVNRRVELFLAIENLFNQRYEVGKTPVTTLGPPLLVRGGFRLRLGSN